MAIEEEIALRHYETGERIVVKAKRTSKEGEYIAHCINPGHPDLHPSMGINVIKGVYNCISRQDASGITWDKWLEGGSKAAGKKSPEKAAKEEMKNEIIMAIHTDLVNWEGYDREIREKVKTRLPFDLALLPENEKKSSIGALVEAGIFRQSELKDRIKKIDVVLSKYKEATKEERKEKKIRTKTLIPGLIHLTKNADKVSYLLQIDGNLYIEETHLLGEGISCLPKQNLPYHHCEPDILKVDREVNLAKLLTDIEDYLKNYLELPGRKDPFILALWVFHTYLIEKFNTTPFLFFHGVPATGKSRAGEALMELSFRGWSMTSPTEASLFRPIQFYEPTIHLDHVRFYGSETNQAVKLLLQSRYKRGLRVVRNNLLKPGEEGIDLYNVFGATVISSEDSLSGALKSRSIIFMMKENLLKRVEKDFDKEGAKSIRDRLIVFRANYENKDLAEVYPSVARRRLAEILNPLNHILMTIAPERKGELEEIIRNLQGEAKDEISTSIEAEIVNCLVNYSNDTKEGSILSSALTEKINEGRPDNDKYKVNFISRECRKLTFKRKLLAKHKARSGFIIDLKLLEELSQKYATTTLNIEGREDQIDLIFPASENGNI